MEENYFIGEVEYLYSYQSDTVDLDSLKNTKPVKSIFRYDLTNYQNKFIGRDTITYFYFSELNICISETNSQKDYKCEYYGIANDSIISFRVYDTDEKVLGHDCKVIEYQSKNMWNKFYVSKQLTISPNTYKKHVSDNWKFYGEKTGGGLILKIEHRFKNYIMRGIAQRIMPQKENFSALSLKMK